MGLSANQAWEQVQKKTFTKWVNTKLQSRGTHIEDLTADLCDGVPLITLLEIIGDEPVGRFYKAPKMRIQKMENCNLALAFIKKRGVNLTNIGAEDIVDGSEKLILGMIWTIILRFTIADISQEGLNAKEGLLLWCQRKTSAYAPDVNIRDFTSSWNDGLAFCALIHRHRPDLLDFHELNKSEKHTNASLAFEVAERSLGIPKLLDVEDVVDLPKPDERSVMTYVAQFFHAFSAMEKLATAGRRVAKFSEVVQSVYEMQHDYEARARKLISDMQEIQRDWDKATFDGSYNDAKSQSNEFKDYKKKTKRSWVAEKRELENMLGNVQTKLKTYNLTPYYPPDGCKPDDLDTAWKKLLGSEVRRKKEIRAKITQIKQELQTEFASLANALSDNMVSLNAQFLKCEGELQEQLVFLKSILEKLESLETKDLPRVVHSEACCTEANIDEMEDTIHTADDLAFELAQAKQAVLKKYNFLENQIVARSITNLLPEQLEEFESAFRHFAKDSSNSLLKDEFNACLHALGVAYSDEEFDKIFHEVSRDKISVNFQQFTNFMVSITEDRTSSDQMRASFKAVANDKVNHLTATNQFPPSVQSSQIEVEPCSQAKQESIVATEEPKERNRRERDITVDTGAYGRNMVHLLDSAVEPSPLKLEHNWKKVAAEPEMTKDEPAQPSDSNEVLGKGLITANEIAQSSIAKNQRPRRPLRPLKIATEDLQCGAGGIQSAPLAHESTLMSDREPAMTDSGSVSATPDRRLRSKGSVNALKSFYDAVDAASTPSKRSANLDSGSRAALAERFKSAIHEHKRCQSAPVTLLDSHNLKKSEAHTEKPKNTLKAPKRRSWRQRSEQCDTSSDNDPPEVAGNLRAKKKFWQEHIANTLPTGPNLSSPSPKKVSSSSSHSKMVADGGLHHRDEPVSYPETSFGDSAFDKDTKPEQRRSREDEESIQVGVKSRKLDWEEKATIHTASGISPSPRCRAGSRNNPVLAMWQDRVGGSFTQGDLPSAKAHHQVKSPDTMGPLLHPEGDFSGKDALTTKSGRTSKDGSAAEESDTEEVLKLDIHGRKMYWEEKRSRPTTPTLGSPTRSRSASRSGSVLSRWPGPSTVSARLCESDKPCEIASVVGRSTHTKFGDWRLDHNPVISGTVAGSREAIGFSHDSQKPLDNKTRIAQEAEGYNLESQNGAHAIQCELGLSMRLSDPSTTKNGTIYHRRISDEATMVTPLDDARHTTNDRKNEDQERTFPSNIGASQDMEKDKQSSDTPSPRTTSRNRSRTSSRASGKMDQWWHSKLQSNEEDVTSASRDKGTVMAQSTNCWQNTVSDTESLAHSRSVSGASARMKRYWENQSQRKSETPPKREPDVDERSSVASVDLKSRTQFWEEHGQPPDSPRPGRWSHSRSSSGTGAGIIRQSDTAMSSKGALSRAQSTNARSGLSHTADAGGVDPVELRQRIKAWETAGTSGDKEVGIGGQATSPALSRWLASKDIPSVEPKSWFPPKDEETGPEEERKADTGEPLETVEALTKPLDDRRVLDLNTASQMCELPEQIDIKFGRPSIAGEVYGSPNSALYSPCTSGGHSSPQRQSSSNSHEVFPMGLGTFKACQDYDESSPVELRETNAPTAISISPEPTDNQDAGAAAITTPRSDIDVNGSALSACELTADFNLQADVQSLKHSACALEFSDSPPSCTSLAGATKSMNDVVEIAGDGMEFEARNAGQNTTAIDSIKENEAERQQGKKTNLISSQSALEAGSVSPSALNAGVTVDTVLSVVGNDLETPSRPCDTDTPGSASILSVCGSPASTHGSSQLCIDVGKVHDPVASAIPSLEMLVGTPVAGTPEEDSDLEPRDVETLRLQLGKALDQASSTTGSSGALLVRRNNTDNQETSLSTLPSSVGNTDRVSTVTTSSGGIQDAVRRETQERIQSYFPAGVTLPVFDTMGSLSMCPSTATSSLFEDRESNTTEDKLAVTWDDSPLPTTPSTTSQASDFEPRALSTLSPPDLEITAPSSEILALATAASEANVLSDSDMHVTADRLEQAESATQGSERATVGESLNGTFATSSTIDPTIAGNSNSLSSISEEQPCEKTTASPESSRCLPDCSQYLPKEEVSKNQSQEESLTGAIGTSLSDLAVSISPLKLPSTESLREETGIPIHGTSISFDSESKMLEASMNGLTSEISEANEVSRGHELEFTPVATNIESGQSLSNLVSDDLVLTLNAESHTLCPAKSRKTEYDGDVPFKEADQEMNQPSDTATFSVSSSCCCSDSPASVYISIDDFIHSDESATPESCGGSGDHVTINVFEEPPCTFNEAESHDGIASVDTSCNSESRLLLGQLGGRSAPTSELSNVSAETEAHPSPRRMHVAPTTSPLLSALPQRTYSPSTGEKPDHQDTSDFTSGPPDAEFTSRSRCLDLPTKPILKHRGEPSVSHGVAIAKTVRIGDTKIDTISCHSDTTDLSIDPSAPLLPEESETSSTFGFSQVLNFMAERPASWFATGLALLGLVCFVAGSRYINVRISSS